MRFVLILLVAAVLAAAVPALFAPLGFGRDAFVLSAQPKPDAETPGPTGPGDGK